MTLRQVCLEVVLSLKSTCYLSPCIAIPINRLGRRRLVRAPHALRKFVDPALPPTILHRESLVTRLNDILVGRESEAKEGAPHCKLMLLCAPAGYGKTTLLADFARDTSIPCCWYFLDRSDVDKITFLENLLASIRQRFRQFGAALDPLLT